jgi:membrane protease subunit HflK
MAWNEPGGSGGRDPWSGRNNGQGEPNLDDIVRKMQDRFGGLFGGKGGGPRGRRGGPGAAGAGIAVVIVLVIWGLSGFYVVDQAERAVVLRFGKYVETTNAGLNWHLPYPIEQAMTVNVERIENVEIGFQSRGGGQQASVAVPKEALMLTQDENIVDIQYAVQYKVKDARDYLFNVRVPDETLREVTESAVREIVGKKTMDFVITEGRSAVAQDAGGLIQETLDRYRTGLQVISVNMQKATAPQQVQAAFADAVKAREDEQRLKNEAEAYANKIIPEARGAAARLLEEANGYRERVIAQAEGEADRFVKVLTEYRKAPEVTRKRLYLEAMERVLGATGKVVMDTKAGNSLMYLPIDRLLERQPARGASATPGAPSYDLSSGAATATSQEDLRNRRNLRSRGIR